MTLPPLSPEMALFLDVDGTLLEHASHPDAVRAGAPLLQLLERLATASGGALALISGRAIDDIERIFTPLVLPAAGQHGAELRLPDGVRRCHSPVIDRLGLAAAELASLTAEHPGLLLENKGMTLALHYRMAPQLRQIAGRTMRRINAALGKEFELQEGKFVYEIKPSGRNKGTAIAELMRQEPFSGRLPVFVGDDVTDEYGFDAVNAMGGHSIKVGAGDTVARWRLADATAVRDWLEASAQRSGRGTTEELAG